MEKIKILGVIDHLDGGGAELQFLNLFNNLDRQLFDIYVFFTEKKGKRFEELSKDIKVCGLVNSNNRHTVKALSCLIRELSSIKPKIIQTWLEYSSFLTALTIKFSRMRFKLVESHRVNIEKLYREDVKFGCIKKG